MDISTQQQDENKFALKIEDMRIADKIEADMRIADNDAWKAKLYICIAKVTDPDAIHDVAQILASKLTEQKKLIERDTLFLKKDEVWAASKMIEFLEKDIDNPFYNVLSLYYDKSMEEILKGGEKMAIIRHCIRISDDDIENVFKDYLEVLEAFEKKPTKIFTLIRIINKLKNIFLYLSKFYDFSILGIPKTRDNSKHSLKKKIAAFTILIFEDYLKRLIYNEIKDGLHSYIDIEEKKTNLILSTPQPKYTKEDTQKLRTTIWGLRIIFEALGLGAKDNIIGKARLIDYLLKENTAKVLYLCKIPVYQYLLEDFKNSKSGGIETIDIVINQFSDLGNANLLKMAKKIKIEIEKNIDVEIKQEQKKKGECGGEYCIVPASDDYGTNSIKSVKRKVAILIYLFERMNMKIDVDKSPKMRFISFICKEYQDKDRITDTQIGKHYDSEISEKDSEIIVELLEGIGLKNVKTGIKKKIKINSKY